MARNQTEGTISTAALDTIFSECGYAYTAKKKKDVWLMVTVPEAQLDRQVSIHTA